MKKPFYISFLVLLFLTAQISFSQHNGSGMSGGGMNGGHNSGNGTHNGLGTNMDHNDSTFDHHDGDHNNPDSLKLITVTGTVIVDTSEHHLIYFLDANNDGKSDYFLNFGPYWYHPDSSSAVRPNNGDTVTITGGLHENNAMDIKTIVVYEINGDFWRSPNYSGWNDMDDHSHRGQHHDNMGHFFGWNHDSLVTVTLSGTALVDSTFMYEQYYLDKNNDSIPDYFLNFGPPWYQPKSGAVRPNDGEPISIKGFLMNNNSIPMVVVLEINSLTWRDSSLFGNHFGGGWIRKNMNGSKMIHSPFDDSDMYEFNPGWHMGGMGSGMGDDSLFCQLLEVYPDEMPNTDNSMFAAFETGIFSPDGTDNMQHNGNRGGKMNFGNQVKFKLHYNDIQIKGFNVNKNSIMVKAWNNQNNKWEVISNAVINTSANTIEYSSSSVSNFIVLTADKVTGVKEGEDVIIDGYKLKQNYPNPFNPSTTIEFEIKSNANVKLNIFNVLGQKVEELVNQNLEAGSYKYNFNATGLSSGIYFYELNADGKSLVKKMSLLK